MIRPIPDPALVHACTRIFRWQSLALCVGIYAAAIGAAWIGGQAFHWWFAVPAFFVIAGLQMHLLILLHEGAHLLLHPDRKTNDLIADIFCAVPFFTLEKNYRMLHLTHHKYSGSPDRDPEVMLYKRQDYHYARRSGLPLFKMLFLDFSGPHAVQFGLDLTAWLKEQQIAGRLKPPDARDIALSLVMWGGVIAGAFYFGFWPELLVFWVLPQLTLTFFFLKIHGYGEHTGATGPTEFERTWIHACLPIEDFFVAPIWSGYHLEHHLFPRVPWYHMGRFRQVLLALPDFAEHAGPVTVSSYFFGKRSIMTLMLWGQGEYRLQELTATINEIEGDVVSADTKLEVESQLPALVQN